MAHRSMTVFSGSILAARPWRAALLGTLVLTAAFAARGDAVVGALSQLGGLDACISDDGSGGTCTEGHVLGGAFGIAISPDGKHVYVAAYSEGAITTLRRSKTTGALTLAVPGACISQDGSGGACFQGVGLAGASRVAVSPDGKHVYVVSEDSDALAAFVRDKATGTLAQLPGLAACVSEDGSGGACADGVGLEDAFGVVVSPDGRHVYVVSYGSNALAAFARDKATGALTQLSGLAACVSEDGSGGACADGVGLEGAIALAMSPDGKHVYLAAERNDAVSVFARHLSTGALTQLAGTDGCVSEDGSAGACADGKALVEPYSLAVSTDGKRVHVAASGSNAVSTFARNRTTGALTQLAGTDACVSEGGVGGCADAIALSQPTSLAISKDGKHLYTAATDSGAVAAFARSRR
jgi:DNA-binding beta-propeller fold protein YncE